MQMRVLHKWGMAVLACMALSACQTTGEVDAKLRAALPGVCSAGETSYVTFTAYVDGGGKVSANTKARVEAAYGSLHGLCADIDNVTAAQVFAASALLAVRLQGIGKET